MRLFFLSYLTINWYLSLFESSKIFCPSKTIMRDLALPTGQVFSERSRVVERDVEDAKCPKCVNFERALCKSSLQY